MVFLGCCVYWLTIVAYWTFHSYYSDKDCESLLISFIINFDQTFKNDGGIGGYLETPYSNGEITSYSRIIYDNLYNFIVMILVVELVAGIIIDTFSEMRVSKETRKQELNSECFICGQTREQLEKKEGFNYHTETNHNIYDYIFFIGYLNEKLKKGSLDFTETERFVIKNIKKNSTAWFPSHYDYSVETEEGAEEIMIHQMDKQINLQKKEMDEIQEFITNDLDFHAGTSTKNVHRLK